VDVATIRLDIRRYDVHEQLPDLGIDFRRRTACQLLGRTGTFVHAPHPAVRCDGATKPSHEKASGVWKRTAASTARGNGVQGRGRGQKKADSGARRASAARGHGVQGC